METFVLSMGFGDAEAWIAGRTAGRVLPLLLGGGLMMGPIVSS
jgi:hypothetical protein